MATQRQECEKYLCTAFLLNFCIFINFINIFNTVTMS